MANQLIPIVFSTDHNFVMPTCVTIHSLLATANPETNFAINVIISPDVTEEDKDTIRRETEYSNNTQDLKFVEIGKVFENGYETRGISTACYSRLLIPWLFPEFDKIFYSDVDIIFRGDISELYSTDMGDSLVGGVNGEVWNQGKIKTYLLSLGLNPQDYINSGFLLINSKLQREENIRERYIELVKNKYLYQDQDIINLACKNRILLLPESYNVKPSLAGNFPKELLKVIHYIGIKPWQDFTYCWVEWWEVYKETCVYDSEFYYKISKKILSFKDRINILKKKIRENLKFKIRLLKR